MSVGNPSEIIKTGPTKSNRVPTENQVIGFQIPKPGEIGSPLGAFLAGTIDIADHVALLKKYADSLEFVEVDLGPGLPKIRLPILKVQPMSHELETQILNLRSTAIAA